ncbi:MAG: polysaccharide deacetylase family protein [Massilia sp.]
MQAQKNDFAIGLVVVALAGAALLGTAVWKLSVSRSFQLAGKLVDRVDTTQKVVALTLDDGPTPGYTEQALAILNKQGVKATFYLVGQDVEKHPLETRAIIAAGHEIGNHSYSHQRMVFVSREQVANEIERTDTALRAAGYSAPLTFRPPYGKKLWELPSYLKQRGMTSVTWDVEPESRSKVATSAANITAFVANEVSPGSIVLMHVMYPARAESLKALPAVITALKAKGYTFVTVSELLKLQHKPG